MKNRSYLSILLVIASSFAFGAGCGTGSLEGVERQGDTRQKKDAAIVGGQLTAEDPAVGALLYWGSPHCTGTLIAPRKVLTAAHCLDGVSASHLRFVIGKDMNNLQWVGRVEEAHMHPDYNSATITNDIGYVILEEEPPVAPMPVLETMDDTFKGEPLLFVGYGVEDGYTETGSGIKRSVWMPVKEIYSKTFLYAESDKNTCFGDSGGPALYEDFQGQKWVAGVTSYGDAFCTRYGVDTRVDVYLDFLDLEPTEEIAEQDPCAGETYEGRCDSNTVIWCENETVYSSECTGTCGWDENASYFNCFNATW